ncbi:MAG: tetratricopeptide repeat protein [Flavobacteriia bacterium]|jgi:tetratricopeptide (TPR) repeat protein
MKWVENKWFWLLGCFVLYANTLNHSYTVDDLIVVKKNSLTQKGIDAIPEIFSHSYLFGYDGREDESYRPITLSTFAIERTFFDASPVASHFIQVILYALFIWVTFCYLRLLFGENRRKLTVVICLLFALHPIHTEVVANIKSRDELLSALFLFSALLFYTKFLRSELNGNLMLSLLFFFLAMLSKETAVLGILLFPATHYFSFNGAPMLVLKRSAVFLSPFVLYFGLRSIVLSDVLIKAPIDPVANSLALANGFGEQLASNFAIFAKYIQLAIFPIHLSWDYSVSQLPLLNFGSLSAIAGVVTLLILIGLLVFGVLRRQLIGYGAILFLATFILTSNFFFLINCPLGERFLFMPVLGILIILVLGFERLAISINKNYSIALFAVICIYYSGRTFVRNADWKNNQTIYESALTVAPNSVKVHFNLATEYLEQGVGASSVAEKRAFFEKAIIHFKAAEKIYPSYSLIYENAGFVYSELAKTGVNKAETIAFFSKGLQQLSRGIDEFKFQNPNLYQNKYYILEQLIQLADNQVIKKKWQKEMIRTARNRKEKTEDDLFRIAFYLKEIDEDEKGVDAAIELVKKYPEKSPFLLEYSEVLFKANRFDLSLKLISAYVDANPEDLSAKSNKGMLLEINGRKDDALMIYEEILKQDPNQQHTRQLYEKLMRQV